MQILHSNVLVLLHKVEDHTTTDSGIIIPQYRQYEAESGKVKAALSDLKYLSKGTVIQVGPDCYLPIKEGDQVYVSPQAVSPAFQFFDPRDSLVLDFQGLVLIPPTLIQAVL